MMGGRVPAVADLRPEVSGCALLAKAVVQSLTGVRVAREPLLCAIADDRGRLAFYEKARHRDGVTGLHAGQPR
jgi:hypothetical protein